VALCGRGGYEAPLQVIGRKRQGLGDDEVFTFLRGPPSLRDTRLNRKEQRGVGMKTQNFTFASSSSR
jgi:hypothetical protein